MAGWEPLIRSLCDTVIIALLEAGMRLHLHCVWLCLHDLNFSSYLGDSHMAFSKHLVCCSSSDLYPALAPRHLSLYYMLQA